MKSRFEPDIDPDASRGPEPILVDPEAYDGTEQQFVSSLSDNTVERPRFIAEEENPLDVPAPGQRLSESAPQACTAGVPPAPLQPVLLDDTGQDLTSWKQEVAARVNNYRGRRRTRGPRYPSLQLKFEEPDWTKNDKSAGAPARYTTDHALALENTSPVPVNEGLAAPVVEAAPQRADTARLIEFPRSGYAPPRSLDELADPVFDRPRILEAPEAAQLPPALGGILIEPAEPAIQQKLPGFDIPLQSAGLPRRLLATATDAVIVLAAFALFGYVFLRMATAALLVPQAVAMSAIVLGALWAAYQYLMLVYGGTTPGLRLMKLHLTRFDGKPVSRTLRRLRVVVSILSGMSLGLGYLWCFLDEDGLCWQDRITRTYMAPKSKAFNR